MTARRASAVAALTAVAAVLAWLLFVGLPRWYGSPAIPAASAARAAVQTPTPSQGKKIKARLFYVGDDGASLTAVERDVPYGENTNEQAREILEAQLAPVTEPLVSAIPPGTTLRAVFVSDHGEAYVDFSREMAAAHPGGTLNELLTTYTVVNALTVNLPAVTAVQLLVDGREVDTLAGHVDLRRPLAKNLSWTQ